MRITKREKFLLYELLKKNIQTYLIAGTTNRDVTRAHALIDIADLLKNYVLGGFYVEPRYRNKIIVILKDIGEHLEFDTSKVTLSLSDYSDRFYKDILGRMKEIEACCKEGEDE